MIKDDVTNNKNKNKYLFDRQKKLLDTFLEHKAITKMQYDKSLGDLKQKLNLA